MPTFLPARYPVLLAALVALAGLCGSASSIAAEVDSTRDTATDTAVATEPGHNIFRSWFGSRSGDEPSSTDSAAATTPASAPQISRTGELVTDALGLLGISYRFGGNTPTSGFDCSGMVRYVFQNALGLDLPRRAEEISRVGMKVSRDDLKPGDLVFYKTLRKAFSHVGIYLGNNRFIHAPSTGGTVRVDNMTEGYWSARFNGARRME